jgi:hypothetical protein
MTIKNRTNLLDNYMTPLKKELIKVAYLYPELRYAALSLVASDEKLKDFAGDRKWKNPETNNLVGLDRILELATKEDKIWAKAIVKKVREEYTRQKGESDTAGIQNKALKKIKGDIESEIKKFKHNKDITNSKDRAEFEAYLEEKLRPVQDEIYQEKIKKETGLLDDEFKAATKQLDSVAKSKALKSLWDIEGKGMTGAVLTGISAALLGGVVVGPLVATAGALSLIYKGVKAYNETPEARQKDEILKDFNRKKEEVKKKIDRETRYENVGKDEAALAGVKEFFKDETFDDDILGDDLTIKELVNISQNKDTPEDASRANKILMEKKQEYMASKFQREKFLVQESRGKKFKSPDGKRVTVKEMIELEEEGDNWASKKLKELRHSLEGPEELGEEETEKEKEDRILRQRGQLDVDPYKEMTHTELSQDIASRTPEELEDLESTFESLIQESEKPKRSRNVSPTVSPNKKNKRKPAKKKTQDTQDSEDIQNYVKLLEVIKSEKKNQTSMEDKYKNESFDNPVTGKTVTFNTLKKYYGDPSSPSHTWAKSEWKKLQGKTNKKGSSDEGKGEDQDELINKIVKDKTESAFKINPTIIDFYKTITTDGKFDQNKLDEIVSSIEDFQKELKKLGTNKKANLDRESLIKLAYHNPDKRAEILRLLIK